MKTRKKSASTCQLTGRAQQISQNEIPVIDLSAEMCPDVAEWYAARVAEIAATARRKQAESRLISNMEPLWRERCRHDGKVHQLVTLNGAAAGKINMLQRNWFRKMTDEDGDRLRDIFGTEEYETYFETKCKLTIQAERFTERHAEGIMRALGNDLPDLLTQEYTVTPREVYRHDRILRKEIEAKVMKAEAVGLAIPHEPLFAVRSR